MGGLTVALPLVNMVVIGARDIDRLRAFYEDLGWPLIADGGLKLFGLRGGALALFPAGRLAEEREQVDALARRVESAGGRITKARVDAESFEGRSCYFADPEDNYFEIAWAPLDNIVVAAARRAAARA